MYLCAQALQLHRLYDLQALRGEVAAEVRTRVAALRTDYPPRGRPLRILPPAARRKLDLLADTGLSDFNFDRILYAVSGAAAGPGSLITSSNKLHVPVSTY